MSFSHNIPSGVKLRAVNPAGKVVFVVQPKHSSFSVQTPLFFQGEGDLEMQTVDLGT